MNTSQKLFVGSMSLLMVCGLTLGAGMFGVRAIRLLGPAATPDFGATLQASIAITVVTSATPEASQPTSTPSVPTEIGLRAGQIVFTCQLYYYQSSEQICIMNADGSGYRRLTGENGVRHFYPSLSPDGKSVVYSQYREDNVYEIYEISLADGSIRRLTDRLGALTGPEISPDGKSIVFMRWTPSSDQDQIWLMDRDGSQLHQLIPGTGWDPTWSPDGSQVLFASDRDGSIQLYRVSLDGSGLQRISSLPAIRGRSDWSSQGWVATYSGDAWHREVYLMRSDGSELHQVSPPGGNSQGPTFSPDGMWIAFTAYFDKPNDINGCEIYVTRVDGTGLLRLTNNDYCDYQPRWGP
jgi:Tol biopolymer transport system component